MSYCALCCFILDIMSCALCCLILDVISLLCIVLFHTWCHVFVVHCDVYILVAISLLCIVMFHNWCHIFVAHCDVSYLMPYLCCALCCVTPDVMCCALCCFLQYPRHVLMCFFGCMIVFLSISSYSFTCCFYGHGTAMSDLFYCFVKRFGPPRGQKALYK